MAPRPAALFFAVSAVAALGTALLAPSCKGFPDKTCYGDKVNALADDGGGAEGADKCTSCMQQSACCDLVGKCGDDPDTCTKNFKATQSCVLDGGPRLEPQCKSNLVDPTSRALYECIRPKCGDKCGIPQCDLDQAVTLFGNATCDRCIGGACCESINSCYKNRSCKLFLECITVHCPRTVGTSMTTVGLLPKPALEQATALICGKADGGEIAGGFNPGDCLNRCLDEFAPVDGGTDDDKAARCLAVGVYTCGASAGCGPHCTSDGTPSTTGPYPEDSPGFGSRDSGTD